MHETDNMQNRFPARTGQTAPTASAPNLANDTGRAPSNAADTRIEDTLEAARALAELGVIESTASIDPVDSDEQECTPYFPLVDDQRRYLEQKVGVENEHLQKSPLTQAPTDIQARAKALEEQRIEVDRKAQESAFRLLSGRKSLP